MANVIEKDQIAVDIKPENNQMVKAASVNNNGKSVKNKGENKAVELNSPKVDDNAVNPELNKQVLVVQPIVVQKETTIIINPLNKGNLSAALEYHIGNNCLDELTRLIKFKGYDISKIDYNKIVEILNFITIQSHYDNTNEKDKTLIELPKTKEYVRCLSWYHNVFTEGFIIVCDKMVNTELVDLLYELDSLKITYFWKCIIDEIADFANLEKNYGFGLIVSDSIKFKYHNGYFLYNPMPSFEMEWEECFFDIILNAVELFSKHIGCADDFETFKSKFVNIMKALLVKRLDTSDFYTITRKVSRKHGIKI